MQPIAISSAACVALAILYLVPASALAFQCSTFVPFDEYVKTTDAPVAHIRLLSRLTEFGGIDVSGMSAPPIVAEVVRTWGGALPERIYVIGASGGGLASWIFGQPDPPIVEWIVPLYHLTKTATVVIPRAGGWKAGSERHEFPALPATYRFPGYKLFFCGSDRLAVREGHAEGVVTLGLLNRLRRFFGYVDFESQRVPISRVYAILNSR